MTNFKNILIILLLMLISACNESRIYNQRTSKPKIMYAIMVDNLGVKHQILILQNDSIKLVYQDINGVIMHCKKINDSNMKIN